MNNLCSPSLRSTEHGICYLLQILARALVIKFVVQGVMVLVTPKSESRMCSR